MPNSTRDSAASTADFPSTHSVFSIEPFLCFVQIVKEQFLVCSRGHDLQRLTIDLMQHPAVGPVIQDEPVSYSDEFCQVCMAFYFSHGRAIISPNVMIGHVKLGHYQVGSGLQWASVDFRRVRRVSGSKGSNLVSRGGATGVAFN
jgi:hypothetical protein